jgi:hypothetical protein
MAQTQEDVEAYLSRLDRRFERLEDGTYLISTAADQPPAALRLAPPVLLLQVNIGTAPEGSSSSEALFRRLLELNAGDLLHAAYGLEGREIVLSAALDLDSLGVNELEAVLAEVAMALSNHVRELHQLVQSGAEG